MPLHPLHLEWDAGLRAGDPLGFPGYEPPGEESVRTGVAEVPDAGRGGRYALIEGRFEVLGGSMGAAHGERVVRAWRRAAEERLPVVVVARSGGARMQEGMVSLIQLPRTAAAAAAHKQAGLLSLAVFGGPTTGGVHASYASLCDLRAAVHGALVGFAGPRVVELTTGERLPADSHTAESAYRHGLVDALLSDEDEQRRWVEAALGVRDDPLITLEPAAAEAPSPAPSESAAGTADGAWAEVLRARHPGRPSGPWWMARLCTSWVALHGTDPCIAAGLATVGGRRLVAVTMNRRRPRPEGFRLAQRAIALAGRLGLPLLTLVDTPGADPGPSSEAGGIAGAIARTFAALAELPTPSVSLCVGEGGSGGALALAATDRLLMLEHAIFSVIAPEGAAAILDRTDDPGAVAARAAQLRLTAADLAELGIADAVIPEVDAGAVAAAVEQALADARPGDRHARLDRATERWIA